MTENFFFLFFINNGTDTLNFMLCKLMARLWCYFICQVIRQWNFDAYSRLSREVTAAMFVYRTIAKNFFWEFDSIIICKTWETLTFCTPTWPSRHVSEIRNCQKPKSLQDLVLTINWVSMNKIPLFSCFLLLLPRKWSCKNWCHFLMHLSCYWWRNYVIKLHHSFVKSTSTASC